MHVFECSFEKCLYLYLSVNELQYYVVPYYTTYRDVYTLCFACSSEQWLLPINIYSKCNLLNQLTPFHIYSETFTLHTSIHSLFAQTIYLRTEHHHHRTTHRHINPFPVPRLGFFPRHTLLMLLYCERFSCGCCWCSECDVGRA